MISPQLFMSIALLSSPFSMMATLPRYNRLLTVCILLFLLLGTYNLLSKRRNDLQQDIHRIYEKVKYREKQVFVQEATRSAIDGPFDDTAIKSLCASTKWNENLIAACGTPQGGVSNVRNVHLNCIRYAIEAGAAFIVPQMIARSGTDLRAITTDKVIDFPHLFDLDHFLTSIRDGCPQMKVYNHRNDLYNIPSTAKPLELTPQDLSREFVHETVLAYPSEWRKSFDEWLDSKTTPLLRNRPILVDLGTPLLQFPLSYDTSSFAQNFGRILRPRVDTKRLAAIALFELSLQFSLNLNPEGIASGAYMGAHLRTEGDAAAAGWTGYDTQAEHYINQALSANITTIFVASGNPSDISRFRKQASEKSLNVTTKHDLLSGDDLKELEKLTWDQQALVDYEILLKSSTFGGVVESSFAWNIALRRNKLTWHESSEYLYGDSGQAFADGLSWLYGPQGRLDFYAYSMWP